MEKELFSLYTHTLQHVAFLRVLSGKRHCHLFSRWIGNWRNLQTKYISWKPHTYWLSLLCGPVFLLLAACASQSFNYDLAHSDAVLDRALTQAREDIRVSVSVPGQEETQAIFGLPLYERGIQPVWIEVENNSQERIRFAPTGLDHYYFSPLEVAYMHRKGFSKEARSDMDRFFHENAMPRQIPGGQTRSGYVFSHASPGTKSFNIDLYGKTSDLSFTFFVQVPGFTPDHAYIDFESLYPQAEIRDIEDSALHATLLETSWVTTDPSGEKPGLPLGIVIVADGLDLLKSLLRAGWYETPRITESNQQASAHHLYGRTADARFRIKRSNQRERNELHLWLSPIRVEGKSVWLALITHFIGQSNALQQAVFGAQFDPDIDDGRNYFMQNLWYSQGLEQMAWLNGNLPVVIDDTRLDFNDAEYFTDGGLIVTWLSGRPVSMLETRYREWDQPPLSQ